MTQQSFFYMFTFYPHKRQFCEKSKKCVLAAKLAIKSLTEENGKQMLKYIKKTGKEIKNLIIFHKKY